MKNTIKPGDRVTLSPSTVSVVVRSSSSRSTHVKLFISSTSAAPTVRPGGLDPKALKSFTESCKVRP